jgi:hypothetical protein
MFKVDKDSYFEAARYEREYIGRLSSQLEKVLKS